MKLKKPLKPLNIRRKSFKGLLAGLLGVVSIVLLVSFWYTLYIAVMPALNTFLFGYMGGANSLVDVSTDVIPYTVIALWAIPALLLCATLNIVWWKITAWWCRLMKRGHRFMMRKYDEQVAKKNEGGNSK